MIRRTFGPEKQKKHEAGENCIMKSLAMSNLHLQVVK
jgi:hypothetical protein